MLSQRFGVEMKDNQFNLKSKRTSKVWKAPLDSESGLYLLEGFKHESIPFVMPGTRNGSESEIDKSEDFYVMSRVSFMEDFKSIKARVIRFHQTLNHPSKERMIQALEGGLFEDWNLTKEDVLHCRDLDTCISCRTGNASFKKPEKSSEESVKRDEPPQMGKHVHIDLVFVKRGDGKSLTYLLGVEESSNYLSLFKLPNKNAESVAEGIAMLRGFYETYDWKIQSINADHDSGILAAAPEITKMGVEVIQVAAGVHERKIEAQVRIVRAYMRSTLP
jgi:hypothetical protein